MSTPRARQRRRVAVVTGTRAEYGLLRSTLRSIRSHPRLELQLAATGMHLLPRFGRTLDDIRRDGFAVDARVGMQRGDDSAGDQAAGLARGVAGLARFFERAGSEVVLVLGDRIEAMAGALAAVTTGRVLAHVHGGDVALGDFDDSLRHAITKLAHLHFVASRDAQRRVLRLGERRENVHLVGAPGLDELWAVLEQHPRPKRRSRVALVVQHAYGRSAAVEEALMQTLLTEVRRQGLRRVVLYPNSDRGHEGVLRAIERHRRESDPGEVEIHRSLPRGPFLRRLIDADVLLGNSSAGLIEAPFAGTPSVNVGRRQAQRLAGGPSVLHAAESPAAIRRALRQALSMRRPRRASRVYGDGRAGERIARVLANVRLDDALRQKLIAY
jgi:GDP/UDP-N,N'-diacetylbacillosamine 2-epimerase (hydrolysing)